MVLLHALVLIVSIMVFICFDWLLVAAVSWRPAFAFFNRFFQFVMADYVSFPECQTFNVWYSLSWEPKALLRETNG